jgi:hypothetical protein
LLPEYDGGSIRAGAQMTVQKLSISMESSLLKLVRDAASEEGVSLSMWLAEAARARARRRALREALADHARRHGPISVEDAERIVERARRSSSVSRARRRA